MSIVDSDECSSVGGTTVYYRDSYRDVILVESFSKVAPESLPVESKCGRRTFAKFEKL